jgi:putative oxidoreductase
MLDSDSTRLRNYGLLVLRVVIGVIFFAHGYMKFFKMGIGGTTGFFASVGVPAPTLAAWFETFVEMIGGIAFILGIFTLPFGLALTLGMSGAIMFAKRGGGLVGPKGFELELALLAAALAIALTGPGALSLRNALRRRRP